LEIGIDPTFKEIRVSKFVGNVNDYAEVQLWPISWMCSENWPKIGIKRRNLEEVTPHLQGNWGHEVH
jgi:hypothetical protein